ncbi:hypothetical protein [uncultured Cedecea sp.]|uniref:hypothetical protein n=1 Tax=uncultured Cedecea sp. TaxID=988762 RepID=UPI002602DAF5|nr:hypothetical protein [uncultured Cedecea sp.]
MELKNVYVRLEKFATTALKSFVFFGGSSIFAVAFLVLQNFFLGPKFEEITISVLLITGAAAVVSALTGGLIFSYLAFSNPLSNKKIKKYNAEILYHFNRIELLKSEEWEDIVKDSMGGKYKRISSQQYLIDERNRLIRQHEERISFYKEMLL